jgi:hypothetical protein
MADFSQNDIIKADEVSKLLHVDEDGSHGVASSTQYGHVKITDSIITDSSDTAASATAIKNVQTNLETTNSNVTELSRKVDGITLNSLGGAPAYSYGTSDLTAGSSALTTGQLHFVYE